MQVIATAGHVDHGKSTLVRTLTDMDPDRWGEERRRGLTVDLGFVWTELAGTDFAFVDVPGHQRFVANMLAGAGPVPAALFVVAADEGWMPQSAEHLAALDAFGVRDGILVVSKSDRADPAPVLADASERIAASSLGNLPAVAVDATSGDGIDTLRDELATLGSRMPDPAADADIRLWVDRAFTLHGAGTVVTGTLPDGTLRSGDELELARTGERVRVRGLESLGVATDSATGVARIALNLRGVDHNGVRRGDALLTPRSWYCSTTFDVRLRGIDTTQLHREAVLHLGAAAGRARLRALDTVTARVTLDNGLPLRAGDRGVLRDPGQHRVAGVEVLDPAPPPLQGRGSATARARDLATGEITAAQLRHRHFIAASELHGLGLEPAGTVVAGWAVDEQHWRELPARAAAAVAAWHRENPLTAGMPLRTLREQLAVPTELLGDVLRAAELHTSGGVIRRDDTHALPASVERAVREIVAELRTEPFRAPASERLGELGLGPRELAAAARAGWLLRLADGVVVAPEALEHAQRLLAELAQPFTVSQARKMLGTTRRVAVPLLERLDAEGITQPLADTSRRLQQHP